MKRKKGYILLDDFTFIKKQAIGSSAISWYTDEKDEYLFKFKGKLQSYRELFYPLILNELGLKTVENDLAQKEDIKGIISKNFNCNHDEIYTIFELYYLYYQNNSWDSKKFNLITLEQILKNFASIKKVQFNKDIMNDFYNQFLIQILLGSSDLNHANMSIFKKDSLEMCPFYDFENYGETTNAFKFQFIEPFLEDDPISFENTIKYFINYASKEKIELFREYLERIKSININKKMELIYEKTEKKVPFDISYKLQRELKDSIKLVDGTLKKLGVNK